MRKTPLRKRNPERKAREFTRAYGGEERVKWIAAQPCVVCGRTPSQNAHVRGGGAGRKADARWVVPLCDICHQSLHLFGQKTCEATWKIDLMHAAEIVDARWEVHLATQPKPETPK